MSVRVKSYGPEMLSHPWPPRFPRESRSRLGGVSKGIAVSGLTSASRELQAGGSGSKIQQME